MHIVTLSFFIICLAVVFVLVLGGQVLVLVLVGQVLVLVLVLLGQVLVFEQYKRVGRTLSTPRQITPCLDFSTDLIIDVKDVGPKNKKR